MNLIDIVYILVILVNVTIELKNIILRAYQIIFVYYCFQNF